MSDLEIGKRKVDSIVILDLDGKIDLPAATFLKNTIRGMIEEGLCNFALNFSKVRSIEKEMVGTIVSINKIISRGEGKLVIFNIPWDVKEYVEHFSFKEEIRIFENESLALEELGYEQDETRIGSPVYLALGSSSSFKEIFWKVTALGGIPVERFELIEPAKRGMAGRILEVILLDALMPRNSALQAVKELRLDKWCKGAVILVVGPDSSRVMFNFMKEYGADDFIPIPFVREELVSSIDAKQFFDLLRRKFELKAEGYYDKK
ncbi:MAG: STAS domain-containing protein [Planctomycetes bacterium]|nr:STAS domain-containing protein [Planctomycetota bacterium]